MVEYYSISRVVLVSFPRSNIFFSALGGTVTKVDATATTPGNITIAAVGGYGGADFPSTGGAYEVVQTIRERDRERERLWLLLI